MTPRVSVCIATHNKRTILDGVLETIFLEKAYPYEVIVVDDGSTDDTESLRTIYPIRFYRINRPPGYRNPSAARNVAMKMAKADVLILQSDDVRHIGPVIEPLSRFREKSFNIATVWNVYPGIGIGDLYTGPSYRRPFFFLGSVQREDIYAIGGNCEDFHAPGWEDDWLGDCLIRGRGLAADFREDVVGYHQDHPRPSDLAIRADVSKALYFDKKAKAEAGVIPWTAATGPWPTDSECLISPGTG